MTNPLEWFVDFGKALEETLNYSEPPWHKDVPTFSMIVNH